MRVSDEGILLPTCSPPLTLGNEYLVLPSGRYVTTDRPEFDRLREVVAPPPSCTTATATGSGRAPGPRPVGAARRDRTRRHPGRRLGTLRRGCATHRHPCPEPTGLVTTLRSYQREGFGGWPSCGSTGSAGILADDMGLGKTLQVLALIAHARGSRPEEPPFLVVAPTSVVTAWADEAARHAPGLRVGVVRRGTDDVAAIAAGSDIVVTTYTLLRLAQEQYAALGWAGLCARRGAGQEPPEQDRTRRCAPSRHRSGSAVTGTRSRTG